MGEISPDNCRPNGSTNSDGIEHHFFSWNWELE